MASDLDAFQDVDPAADFLAREQNALQALDDDLGFANDNNFEALNGDLNHKGENGTEEQSNLINDVVSDNAVTNQIKGSTGVTGNGFVNSDGTFKEIKEEPEKIRKWREEQQRLLEQKDLEEAKRKEELREQAKKELEEWYLRYSEQLEKSKLNNRNAEKEWIAERDTEAPGQEWEKIARMCDFNPKAARNTRDTSRMRSILLQLKQSPPAATTPAAATAAGASSKLL